MKKLLLSWATISTLLFANTTVYNYEITPTLGGVLPESNLDIKEQLNYGLRFGINLDNTIVNQFELGYDKTNTTKYDAMGATDKTSFNRYYGNLVKEYKMSPEMALYSLVGLGYEDIKNEMYDNEDSMFAQYGGGVKYWVSDNFALKAEVRHAMKFHGGDNNLFYTLGFVMPFDVKQTPLVATVEPKKIPVIKEVPKDSDGDGVLDEKDQCPNTPKGAVVDEMGCVKIIRLHVNFALNQTTIEPSFMREIQKVADFMKINSAYQVVLEGHTDAKGSQEYNQKLSDKRAKAVAKALVDLGIPASKITTEAYGESKPVASNDTEEGRAENRRVDAKFSK